MTDIAVEKSNNAVLGQPFTDEELEALLKAGVHLGHAKSKNHPSMQPFIFGLRNNISIIDLTKTKEKLHQALDFIKSVVAKNGIILLVGTRPAAKKIVAEVAEKSNMPYLTGRWIGGALTNFKVIVKRVEYMENLEKEKAEGGFEKYTKKERLDKDEEIIRLQKMFHGLRPLKRLPEAVFVVNMIEDETPVREARRLKIPSIALTDTNSNVSLLDWPIPSNDDAMPAVKYMVERIGQAIEEGKKMAEAAKISNVNL
jgi:small subunit ribosomal protein S2